MRRYLERLVDELAKIALQVLRDLGLQASGSQGAVSLSMWVKSLEFDGIGF